jgi:hypothetical protein
MNLRFIVSLAAPAVYNWLPPPPPLGWKGVVYPITRYISLCIPSLDAPLHMRICARMCTMCSFAEEHFRRVDVAGDMHRV